MKFHIINQGDIDVGIDGFEVEAVIPNIGFENEEWITWCKEFLHELYSSEIKSTILTDDEYSEMILGWEDYEKAMEENKELFEQIERADDEVLKL